MHESNLKNFNFTYNSTIQLPSNKSVQLSSSSSITSDATSVRKRPKIVNFIKENILNDLNSVAASRLSCVKIIK